MKLADVVLDIQTNQFSKPITYAICDESCTNSNLRNLADRLFEDIDSNLKVDIQANVGCVVVVPFGKQYKLGFIVNVSDVNDEDVFLRYPNIKPIMQVLTESFFDDKRYLFAKFLSEKYFCSMATCLRLFTPVGACPKLKHIDEKWKISVHNFRELKNNFENKYYSNVFEEDKSWRNFNLTQGQDTAYKSILSSIEKNEFQAFVLNGVTGSGKTEVYLRAIQKVIENGGCSCVLVPEISLTPQILARFKARFGDLVAILHSKMTPSERYNQYQKIKQNEKRIIVGARSALFAPYKQLDLIIVDEEHENSYKQDKSPRYNTRDCAEFLAKQYNAALVLGSATPSLEAYFSTQTKNDWQLIDMPERTNKQNLPKIEIVDMSLEFKGGRKSLFSYSLSNALYEELSKGHKVLLFHNRRGFANYLFCRNCGFIPTCDKCSTKLTYHQKYSNGKSEQNLICHHCGRNYEAPVKCPECGSPYIAKYGAGTQNVEDSLIAFLKSKNLDSVNVVRMDADTISAHDAHLKQLEKFAKPGPAVLLGTQMIAKGLDFDDVTLVGIVLIDTNLALPDFRASERTFNIIQQVAGRAGRKDLTGKVIVQTYSAQDECIELAADYNKKLFHKIELEKRRLLHYPPYYQLINVLFSGIKDVEVKKCCDELFSKLEKWNQNNSNREIDILPSSSCVIEKIRDRYRYHILIKIPLDVHFDMAELQKIINNHKCKASVRMIVDVDPISLL